MKTLTEYLFTVALALAAIAFAYHVFASALTDLVTQALQPLTR